MPHTLHNKGYTAGRRCLIGTRLWFLLRVLLCCYTDAGIRIVRTVSITVTRNCFPLLLVLCYTQVQVSERANRLYDMQYELVLVAVG